MITVLRFLKFCALYKWKLVALGILAIGLYARFIRLNYDAFDFDGYGLMTDIELPFSSFVSSTDNFALPMRVHYWISNRLFGGEFQQYLILPVLASMLTLIALFAGLALYWKRRPVLGCIALTLFALNSYAAGLASYSMFPYAHSLLFETILFFLLLHLAIKEEAQIDWKWTPALFIAAFFTNLTVAVPAAAGAAAVFLFRLLKLRTGGFFTLFLQTARSLLPLFAVPIAFIATYALQPFRNLGRENRPDMEKYFYAASGDGLTGMVRYLARNFNDLLSEIAAPATPVHIYALLGLAFLTLAALVSGALISGRRRVKLRFGLRRLMKSRSGPVAFTALYAATITLASAAGGLIGAFPFGTVRYSTALIVPGLILFAHLICFPAIAVQKLLFKLRPYRKIRGGLSLVALAVWLALLSNLWRAAGAANAALKRQEQANEEAIQFISGAEVACILVSNYRAPIIDNYRGGLTLRGELIKMGWGSYWKTGADGGISPAAENCLSAHPAGGVMVVLHQRSSLESEYQSYAEFLNSHFELKDAADSRYIWAGVYVRKTSRSR